MRIIFLVLVVALSSWGFESTQTLPAGINNIQIRHSQIDGLALRYNPESSLVSQRETQSVELNSESIRDFEPEFEEIENLLNDMTGYGLGSELHLGYLDIDPQPEIEYTALVYARGITKKWTLGIGIPVINYKNKMKVSHYGSNVAQISELYRNRISPELDAGFDRLNIDGVEVLSNTLRERGYKPLQSRDDSFIGDLQVVSMYGFDHSPRFKSQLRNTLVLPTGPEDDPDDLLDIDLFHQSSFDTSWVSSYRIGFFEPFIAVGYNYFLPQDMIRRVPESKSDRLPDQNSKRNVTRQRGSEGSWAFGASLHLGRLTLGAGLLEVNKSQDTYDGDGRVDLLAADTEGRWKDAKVNVTYSTVQSYLAGASFIPFQLTYNYSDLIEGVNIERRRTHEIRLSLFF